MNIKNLIIDKEDKIATIKINRPEKLNALTIETIDELKAAFKLLMKDEYIYVVVLTGTGEKAFAAGADIAELNQLNEDSGFNFSKHGQELFDIIEKFNKPVIAAVNGFALGGGCELALACHIRFASENAKFGQPEVNLGIIPGFGGTQRLSKLINKALAMEMILSGQHISSAEAYRIGLVNKIFKQEELLPKTLEFAKLISRKGQIAIRGAIQAINFSMELHPSEGQNFESKLFAECCSSKDFNEGTTAFLEKRKPVFTNK